MVFLGVFFPLRAASSESSMAFNVSSVPSSPPVAEPLTEVAPLT